MDLEPRPAAVVIGGRSGRLGHVQRDGTGMIHGNVGVEGELIASPHGDGLGAVAGLAADVAPQVSGRQVLHGPVLEPFRVRVPADVRPRRIRGPTSRELMEDVVARDGVGREGGSRGEMEQRLHDERSSTTSRHRVELAHGNRVRGGRDGTAVAVL